MQLYFEGLRVDDITGIVDVVSFPFNRGLEMTSQQTADSIADMIGCDIYHWSRLQNS